MDIDIDTSGTFDPTLYFKQAIRASMVKNGILKKHPVGVYFQKIATDPITDLAAIPYDIAEQLGFFKIDFLHLTLLDFFESKEEIRELLDIDPDWNLLHDETVVKKLFQIHNHFNRVKKINPKNIQELADTTALIRPGKQNLIDAYIKDKEAVRPLIYLKPENNKYYFKRGHAIAYAHNIVLQMHLIKGGII